MKNPIARPIRIWLFIGVFMVFMQVVIGGITRLTDSGLSITEWKVIQGTLPPMNQSDWQEAFELYKVAAKKQYESLHADMSLAEFKVIFFWEYLHRLWARTMGFVFLFPFLFFLWKKQLPGWLLKRLGVVVLLAALAATFGWIMVASGLNDSSRTWVSAYKLSVHLMIATAVYGSLFWTWLRAIQPKSLDSGLKKYKKWAWGITVLLLVQFVFGGLMAGMRAGLIHPYFPFFVEGERLAGALSTDIPLTVDNLVDYEVSVKVKAWVQVLHRSMAYLLVLLISVFSFKLLKQPITDKLKTANYWLLGGVGIQFLLGVLTVINCFGSVPILYGALHQAMALVLFSILLFNNYQFRS